MADGGSPLVHLHHRKKYVLIIWTFQVNNKIWKFLLCSFIIYFHYYLQNNKHEKLAKVQTHSHERTEMTRVYYYIHLFWSLIWYYYYVRSLHNLSLEGVESFTCFPPHYTYIDTKIILHLVKYFLTGVPVLTGHRCINL